jgi:hypothetical protein
MLCVSLMAEYKESVFVLVCYIVYNLEDLLSIVPYYVLHM